MKLRRVTWCLSLLAVLAAACGTSHSEEPDMGETITFDASSIDFGSDAGVDEGVDSSAPPAEGAIGAACDGSDGSCAEGNICITDFAGGYCSRDCTMTESCPDGAECVRVGFNQAVCLDSCVAGASPRQCREGYGCSIEAGSVCLEGCTDDSDCPGGACDPLGGTAGACYTPGAMLGTPCTDDSQCSSGGFCANEEQYGYPAGTCIGQRCGLSDGTGCDGDGVCIDGGGEGICFDGCAEDTDCRDGYRCVADDAYPTRKYCSAGCRTSEDCTVTGFVCNAIAGTCAPPFDASELGSMCSMAFDACAGGECLREGTTGFPRSYCTYIGCTPGDDATDGCPGTGVCVSNRTGSATFCLEACETSADCRAEYACAPSDPSNAESARACVPACEADTDCQYAMRRGFVCNNGTGLCQTPFDSDVLMMPCTSGDVCTGGTCMTEAFDGFPGGACVATGCRLSGEGGSEACPGTTVCVPGNQRDPSLGICMASCSTSAPLPCRTGYACEALVEGETAGVCKPACTEGSCSDGRVCEAETGLCRTAI